MRLAVEKYGKDAFYVGIIEQVDDTIANERETYWIKELGGWTDGYNSKPEAIGTRHSAETRAKMSASHKGKPSNRKGKKRSPEEIAKMKATFARRREQGLNIGCPKGTTPWNKGRPL